ncbi:DUF4344 domain-containing metallopeptidase [Pseudaestuariivita sp.]|uniref:DUF4344 domain-containing metallopeptidase n=1 Tax=Pseudaestuariivita sp. TaxID=2211669 RepID=UPI00405966E4
MKYVMAALCALGLAGPAQAEFDPNASESAHLFVEDNLLGIFYHELGHALIHILDLPIYGQEEDAADVASIYLIDAFFDEETAVAMAYNTAFGFLAEAEETGDDIAWWGEHGPDLQRYYNLVCLFYGANPDERDDVAEELGLPEERAEICPDEYDQAARSWGAALDSVVGSGSSVVFVDAEHETPGALFTADVIATEVDALNEEFDLPGTLTVRVESCGEANAFYDLDEVAIVMCTEFTDALAVMAEDFM